MKYSTSTKLLPNGIEILYIDIPGITTFDLAVGIKSGYRFANKDNADLCELPHILEHMVFDGSRRYPEYDTLEDVFTTGGGTWNGTTTPYLNLFPFHNRARNAIKLIDAALDCIFFPTLTEQSFAEEMTVIENELQQNMNDFAGNAFAFAAQKITPEYIFSTDVQLSRLGNITYETVKKYHKKYYVTKNTRIVMTADFTLCKKTLIEKQILETTRGVREGRSFAFPKFTVAEAKPDDIHGQQIGKDSQDITASLQFFKKGELSQQKKSELRLFVFLASSMKSYSVNHILRKKGLIYGLELDSVQSEEGHVVDLEIAANSDKFVEIYAYTLQQLRTFVANGVTDEQFTAAKREYIEGFDDIETSIDGIVDWYSPDFLLHDPLITVDELRQVYEKIEQREVLSTAAEFVQYDTLRAAVFAAKPIRVATSMAVLIDEILKQSKDIDDRLLEENGFGVLSTGSWYKKIVHGIIVRARRR